MYNVRERMERNVVVYMLEMKNDYQLGMKENAGVMKPPKTSNTKHRVYTIMLD